MPNRLTLAIGLGLILSLIAISSALTADRQPGDVRVASTIQEIPGGPFADLMEVGDWAGSFWGLGLIGIALIAVLLLRRRRVEATFVLTCGAWYIASPLIKTLVGRPRPTTDELIVPFIQTNYAFPSGHVFGATIVLGTLLLFSSVCLSSSRCSNPTPARALRIGSIILFAVIALSRIYLGQHLPSDIIGAFVISATGMAIIYALFRSRFKNFGKVYPATG